MSKQTINIGASPNDGTGTPLRTSFDYCNQNFTELYTATGPSGNNIVVPGNATITGDLTVDTSTLKVDSTNNRVGIGTATPGAELEVYKSTNGQNRVFINNPSTGAGAYNSIDFTAGTSNNAILSIGSNNTASFPYTAGTLSLRSGSVNGMIINTGGSAAPIQFGINDTLAMTLNSTGLGVGVVPSTYKLEVGNGSVDARALFKSNNAFSIGVQNGASGIGGWIGSTGNNILTFSGNDGTMKVTISDPGNVGVGVTPSAWFASSYKALQVNTTGVLASFGSGSNQSTRLANNWFSNTSGVDTYITSNFATVYQQTSGGHQFFTAASGTAGNAITFTQAMTLDTSGNLLVGKTATNLQVVGCELKANGTVFSTLVDTTDAAASSYQLYSTGAAAYRFYVGLGGTVFATNTTISAISDARLKENVQDLDVGLNAILALKPRKFDWKAGKGKDIKGDRGFIAQEFETVFPNLVDEWKDPAPEGEAPYKSVRQDLIPVLVKAIQELTARVQTLEAR